MVYVGNVVAIAGNVAMLKSVPIMENIYNFISLPIIPCFMYYIKNAIVIKDKIPPMIKNGAKGMYFCFWRMPQIIPDIHAITNAMANHVAPNHTPPVASNFMSPMPSGMTEYMCRVPIFSKMKPINVANIYPDVAAITD